MTKKTPKPELRNIDDVSACTCTSLRKAARVVTQAYDDALRPVGLRATQFTLLATLVKCGDTPLTQLAHALVMDRTTLTRNLQPLVRRGLINIAQTTDQRVRQVSLGDAGKRAFQDALPRWRQVQKQITDSLGREKWSGFMDDLSRTVAAAQNH